MYDCGPLSGPPVLDRNDEPEAKGTEWSAETDCKDVRE